MTHNADFIGLVWGVKLWGRVIAYSADSGTAFTPAITITQEVFRIAALANGNSLAQTSIEPLGGRYLIYTDKAQVWSPWMIIAK